MLAGRLTPARLSQPFYRRDSVGNTLQTIVAPAANVAGVIVTRCGTGGVNDNCRIMAKASAPTGLDDGAANTLCYNPNDAATGRMGPVNVSTPIVVPPGLGVYAITGIASQSFCYVEYEVL